MKDNRFDRRLGRRLRRTVARTATPRSRHVDRRLGGHLPEASHVQRGLR